MIPHFAHSALVLLCPHAGRDLPLNGRNEVVPGTEWTAGGPQ